MADAVQGVTIADQNAQRPFGRRRRDVNRNLVDQSIPPIWTEHGFNRNVVTGTGFGYVSPGTFQTRRAAVADKVKIKLHTANIRHAVWIVVNAAEAVAEGKCRQDSGWLATVSRGKHVFDAYVGISAHADPAIHAVGNVLAVFVHSVQGVEYGCHHCQWTEVGIVQHLIMKLLGRGPATDI